MTEIDGLSFDEWLDREKKQLDEDGQRPVRRRQPEQTAYVDADGLPAQPRRQTRRAQEQFVPERAPRREKGPWDTWKKLLIPLTVLLLAGVLALGAGFVYANKVAEIDTIYPNVAVNGVAVGGMSVEEAAVLLGEAPDKYDNAAVTVRFSTGESVTVTAQQLGLKPIDGTAFAQAAYDYGRGGSLLANMKDYLYCRSNTLHMQVSLADTGGIDENAIAALVTPVAQAVDEKLAVTQAQIGQDAITLVKDAAGQTVDVPAVCALVRTAFEQENYADIDYDATVQGQQPDVPAIDVDAMLQQLYDQVFVAPADAMYDPVTGGVTDSVTGVRIDLAEARRLWDEAAPGANVTIPLIREEPSVTGDQLRGLLFADVLAEKSTSLAGSSSARINNITLAAAAMNGVVLQPGEEFNYNNCLGERTAAKGYQSAGAYSAGQHVMSIGGGICQGSSTLYYCALKANLAITERHCHQFLVAYLPRGMDATVSWGYPEFKFMNNRQYPIRIEAWVSGGSLTIRIVGTNVDGSYVDITNETWEDASHYYAQTYRNVYDRNGNLISSSKEAYSCYDKEEALKAAQATPAPTQEPVQQPDIYTPPTLPEAPAETVPEVPAEPLPETPVEPAPEVPAVPDVPAEVIPESVPDIVSDIPADGV